MKHFDTQSEVLCLVQDLISIESHSDVPGREAAIGRFLVNWFQNHGIEAELQSVEAERANLVATIPGSGGPSLMLNGHMDTVPAGSMSDAYEPSIREGVLWGRGACDMKGAIAAMACAMAAMVQHGETSQLTGELLFTGTVGEETGSIGVKALVEAGVKTSYAIVGEPTSLRVGIAHKGACFIRISLTGRGAHGSRPDEGVNAVSYASQIVRALETDLRAKLAKRVHPLLGTSTVSVGRISGGTQPNIVAERCFVDIDRRTLPDEDDIVEEITALVAGICDPIVGLSCGTLRKCPKLLSFLMWRWGPLLTLSLQRAHNKCVDGLGCPAILLEYHTGRMEDIWLHQASRPSFWVRETSPTHMDRTIEWGYPNWQPLSSCIEILCDEPFFPPSGYPIPRTSLPLSC